MTFRTEKVWATSLVRAAGCSDESDEALEDKLEELGVDEAEDLRLCDEGDLAELRAGLKKVVAKFLQLS